MVLNAPNDERGIEILCAVVFVILFYVHHEIADARPDKCQGQRGRTPNKGSFQRFKKSTITHFPPLKVGVFG